MNELVKIEPKAHTPLAPFAATSGPRNAKMLLIGEAWGESEAQSRRPFAGASGQELFRMLGEAMPTTAVELHTEASRAMRFGLAWLRPREDWLNAAGIAMTNVLAFRPRDNKLENISAPKTDLPDKGRGYDWPAIQKGRYLLPNFLSEITRLRAEIDHIKPNLIVALGNTACWALLKSTSIGAIRGTVTTGVDGRKVLPTYHPAGVLRKWDWRPIVVADLMKAAREASWPEIRRLQRGILVNPTIREIREWIRYTLDELRPSILSCDIETVLGQIKCIGFARSRSEAMIIPFVDSTKSDGSYWPTAGQEGEAWNLASELLASSIPKLFQNGMYDLQYLARAGLTVNNCREDSMLLHHSIFPELQKGLGFLGSIYTSEPAWKLMRTHKADTEKRDE